MIITVEVAGENYRALDNYNIRQQSGSIASSDVTIRVEAGQSVPLSLSPVIIYKDAVPFFFGIIQSVTSPTFNGGKEVKLYRLAIMAGETIFNNRLVSNAFENKTTYEIVSALFTEYIAEEGITLGAISAGGQLYDNYNCSFTNLYEVLKELAEDVNASFYISPTREFYFLTRGDFIEVDMPAHSKGLTVDEDSSNVRTVQIITGATEETAPQVETTFWAADQTALLLAYPVMSIGSISINALPVGVGVVGLDNDDVTKTFLFANRSNSITLNTAATIQPEEGDTIEVVYIGFYEILLTTNNDQLKAELTALNGTSGKIETVLSDDTLSTFNDATIRASALLTQYGQREQTVSCECHDFASTELLTIWNINRPDLNIVGKYVVTQRDFSSFGKDAFSIRVSLNSSNYSKQYGTVLYKTTKSVGKDTKVYKQSVLSDTVRAVETMDIQHGALVAWPSDDFVDPLFDTFYPE